MDSPCEGGRNATEAKRLCSSVAVPNTVSPSAFERELSTMFKEFFLEL